MTTGSFPRAAFLFKLDTLSDIKKMIKLSGGTFVLVSAFIQKVSC